MPEGTPRQRRQRTTRPIVKIMDTFWRVVISIGGVATIFAVLGVCFFLFWKSAPLFFPSYLERETDTEAALRDSNSPLLMMREDEYRQLALTIKEDGTYASWALASGEKLQDRVAQPALAEDEIITLRAEASVDHLLDNDLISDDEIPVPVYALRGREIIVATSKNRVFLGRIAAGTYYIPKDSLPEAYHDMASGEHRIFNGADIYRTKKEQFRAQKSYVLWDSEPLDLKKEGGIEFMTVSSSKEHLTISLVDSAGNVTLNRVQFTLNMFTGNREPSVRTSVGKLEGVPTEELAGVAIVESNPWVIAKDGRVFRFKRERNTLNLAESRDLLPSGSVSAWIISPSGSSLHLGADDGSIRTWFMATLNAADAQAAGTAEGQRGFTLGYHYPAVGAPVTAMSISGRSRLVAAAFGDGSLRLFNSTTKAMVATANLDGAWSDIAITPKEDGVSGVINGMPAMFHLGHAHHEITMAALFLPVHYEATPAPIMKWSSTGGDSFEPRLSLWPLIWGTLKATVYALLIGVPIALVAAIYSAEFLQPKAKNLIKPGIELMASLPSVVLGFVGGLVVASIVQDHIMAVLMAIITVPLSFMISGYIWQLMPTQFIMRNQGWRLIILAVLSLPLGVVMAIATAPIFESLFFTITITDGGESYTEATLIGWLGAEKNPAVSTGMLGGWMFLFFPSSIFLIMLVNTIFISPFMRNLTKEWDARAVALADTVRFGGLIALTLISAVILSFIMGTIIGIDARGSVVDEYQQRNALVVGFMMGFAIIPIIYTIADDALSSVPDTLRSASLGCGASPWQTALKVTVPTAMSGIFSAIMVGLGRAVGETMIVLMAAGGTAIMHNNIFDGFRTMSANIATEMPESPVDGAHYRLLFLTALLLFLMTFVLNTGAEFVRQHFRKRAFDL